MKAVLNFRQVVAIETLTHLQAIQDPHSARRASIVKEGSETKLFWVFF